MVGPSSLRLLSGAAGAGTPAPSGGPRAGADGVPGEISAAAAGGASSAAWPSWYAREVTCRRSSGSTSHPRGNILMARVLKVPQPKR
eukprot:6913474-Alexandrium_andersonii.AAC.1